MGWFPLSGRVAALPLPSAAPEKSSLISCPVLLSVEVVVGGAFALSPSFGATTASASLPSVSVT